MNKLSNIFAIILWIIPTWNKCLVFTHRWILNEIQKLFKWSNEILKDELLLRKYKLSVFIRVLYRSKTDKICIYRQIQIKICERFVRGVVGLWMLRVSTKCGRTRYPVQSNLIASELQKATMGFSLRWNNWEIGVWMEVEKALGTSSRVQKPERNLSSEIHMPKSNASQLQKCEFAAALILFNIGPAVGLGPLPLRWSFLTSSS